MTEKASLVQYVGYKVTRLAREYTFAVRPSAGDAREFCLSILNEAFNAQRVRFQDAAEICSIRLRQELLAAPLMDVCAFHITDGDLDAYRAAHSPKKRLGFFSKNV